MQTSKKKMPAAAKVLLAVVVFLLCAIAAHVIFLIPHELVKAQDFNTVIIGGSEGSWGVNAAVLSEDPEILAANLAAGPALCIAREEVLKGALKRYGNLDTVVIEISHDALGKDIEEWTVDNKGWVIPKMVTLDSALRYSLLKSRILWYEFEYVIGIEMTEALDAWENLFDGTYPEYYRRALSKSASARDMSYTARQAKELYQERVVALNYKEPEIGAFQRMLELCREAGLRTIVISMPLPESTIWNYSGWDAFRETMQNLMAEYDCEYYDFNLYKDRQQILSDEESFRDDTHLSGSGADAFSEVLRDQILNRNPEEAAELFYDSFAEEEPHSRYMAMVQ